MGAKNILVLFHPRMGPDLHTRVHQAAQILIAESVLEGNSCHKVSMNAEFTKLKTIGWYGMGTGLIGERLCRLQALPAASQGTTSDCWKFAELNWNLFPPVSREDLQACGLQERFNHVASWELS
jgi:hypothetical protein